MAVSSCTKTCGAMSRNAENLETEFCEEVPDTVGFTLLGTPLTVRSPCHPKCHPQSRTRRRTISRIAVANSPHFGCSRHTHGPQWLLGIFYWFECPQTQQTLAYFAPRLFQRFDTSRFVECVGSRRAYFSGRWWEFCPMRFW
jgi:hypothetical protein